MRVIQLGPFPPPHGGVQTNLVAIRNQLRSRGHRAAVIHLTRHRRHDADEVFYPKTALETAWLLLSEPADILHLHIGGDLSNRLLALGLFCSLVPGRKSVLTFHSGGYPSSSAGQAITYRSPAARILRRFDAVIAVNEEIAGFFRRCGVRDERLNVISPHASSDTRAELPEPLSSFYAAHDPVLLSVGLLEPEYALPLQISALGQIRQRRPRAGLIMIGSGSQDSDLRSAITRTSYSADLLLPGDVPHEVTLRAIRDFSILLRTTHYDGDSISVREALDLGTPVIATDNGMRPPGCRLIPSPSLEPLVEAIEDTLLAGARSRTYTRGCEGTKNLDAVLAIYESLMRR